MRQGRKVFDADFGDVIEAHAEGFKDGRREGVIEGLERALGMNSFHHGYVSKVDILTEIERLRAEQEEQP